MMSWAAAQAKAQFGALLNNAESEGPQLFTRRKTRYVVLTEEGFRTHKAEPEVTEPEPFVSV